MAFQMISGVQQQGGVCALVALHISVNLEAETERAEASVSIGDLLVSEIDSLDQAIEIIDTLVRTGAVSLVVFLASSLSHRRAALAISDAMTTVVAAGME